jgi:hypothetical protein
MAPYNISSVSHHRDEAALTLLAHITETSHGHTSKLSDIEIRVSVLEDGIITRNDITAGTGVILTEDAAANTLEISIGQDVAPTSNVTFNQITTTSDVIINGDLTVNGGSTYIYSTTKVIADPLIELANGNNGNSYDIGFYGTYKSGNTTLYTGLVWDASASSYKLFKNLTTAPTNNEFTFSNHTVATLEAQITDITNHTINSLNDVDTSTNGPNAGQVLAWNGTNWAPADDNNDTYTGGTGIAITTNDISIDFSEFTTDDITEGTTKLFHTSERVDDRVNELLQAGSNIALNYDDNNGTLTIDATDTNTEYTAGTGVIIQNTVISIGQDVGTTSDVIFHTVESPIIFSAVANVNISKGQIVYISGTAGNGSTPTVALAQANSSNTMPAFGIAAEQATSGNPIKIVTFGTLKGISLPSGITFALGDTLYVSATTAGEYTNAPPTGESNLIQNIGKLQRHSQPGNSNVIKVGGAGRTNATPNLNSGNIFYGSTLNKAVPTALTAGNNVTITLDENATPSTLTISALTDGGSLEGESQHISGSVAHTDTVVDIYNTWESDTQYKGAILTLSDNSYDSATQVYTKTVRAAIKGGTSSTGTSKSGHLAMYTSDGTNNDAEEVARFTPDGKFGLGITDPFSKLDIFGEYNTIIRVHRPNNTNVAEKWGIGFSTRNDSGTATTDIRAGIYAKYNGQLFIANDTSDVNTDPESKYTMWFANNNHTGIGTKSPLAPLHVDKYTSTQGHAVIIGDSTSYVDVADYHYPTRAPVFISGRRTNADGTKTDNWAGIQFATRNTTGTNWYHGYSTFNDEGDIEHGLSGLGTTRRASTSVKIGETGTGYIISNSYDETATNPHIRSFTITSGTKSLSDSKGAYIRGYGVDSTITPGLLQLNAGNTSTGEIIMYTGGNDRVYIKNSGYVGISEDDPQSLLHLTGDSQNWTTSPTIIFESTNTNANVRNWRIGPADTNFGNFHIAKSATQGTYPDSDAEAQIFTIDYQGKVGINTKTPNVQLDIVGGITTGGQIRLSSAESANPTLKDTRIVSRHHDPSEEDIMLIGCRSDSGSNVIRIGGGRGECNTATKVLIYTADTINEINNDAFVNITNNNFGIDTGSTGPQRKFHLVNRDGDSTTCFAMENIRSNSNTNQNTTVISFREEIFTGGVGTTFHESGAIQFKMENSNTDTNNGLQSSLSLYTYNDGTFSDNFSLIGENSDTKGKHRARKGTTTDNECIMYTFRVSNTGNSGDIWVKLGTFTAGQSSRIILILHGQSSYSGSQGNISGNCTITGQVNNSNTLEGNFHQEGGKKSILGVNFTSTNSTTHEIYIQVGSYSEYGCQVNCSTGTFTHGVVQNVSGISANIGSTKKHFNPNGNIFAEGNVGINCDNPQTALQTNLDITGSYLSYINGTSHTFDSNVNMAAVHNCPTFGSGQAAGLTLVNNDKSNGAPSPLIAFSAKSQSNTYNHTYACIYGIRAAGGADSNWTRGDIVLATGEGTGPKERLRVLSDGSIAAGISSSNGRRFRVHGSGDMAQFTCINNTAGGAQIDLTHERADASPANGDNVGIINFGGLDSGGSNPTLYGTIATIVDDVANKHGHIIFKTRDGSIYDERIRVTHSGTLIIRNNANGLDSPTTGYLKESFIGNHDGTLKMAVNGASNGSYGSYQLQSRKGDSSDPRTIMDINSTQKTTFDSYASSDIITFKNNNNASGLTIGYTSNLVSFDVPSSSRVRYRHLTSPSTERFSIEADGDVVIAPSGTGHFHIRNATKHYSGTTDITFIEHFYRFSTLQNIGASNIHLKTDIIHASASGSSAQMFSFEFKGHEYGASKPVNANLVFYNYPPNGGVVNVGSDGTHNIDVYNSSDNKIVIRIAVTDGYYTAFTVSQLTTSQQIREVIITASAHNTSATHF